MTTAASVRKDLAAFARLNRVSDYLRFFKAGPGEYGEGDEFIGVRVPDSREVAKAHKDLPLSEIQKLLDSKIHEERFVGLAILIYRFKKAQQPKSVDLQMQKEIFDFFSNKYLNNASETEKVDLMFRFIQYIERQIVLFDAIEESHLIKLDSDVVIDNQKYDVQPDKENPKPAPGKWIKVALIPCPVDSPK